MYFNKNKFKYFHACRYVHSSCVFKCRQGGQRTSSEVVFNYLIWEDRSLTSLRLAKNAQLLSQKTPGMYQAQLGEVKLKPHVCMPSTLTELSPQLYYFYKQKCFHCVYVRGNTHVLVFVCMWERTHIERGRGRGNQHMPRCENGG